SGSNTAQQPEVLLPQPEAPAAPPVPAPSTAQPSTPPPTLAPSASTAPPPAPAAPSAPATTRPAMASITQPPPPPPQPTAPPPTSTKAATAAPSATTKATASSATGNYRIQLAASKSEADATRFWKQLSTKYPDIVGGLPVHIEKADLGTKGIYYRVQAGGFAD